MKCPALKVYVTAVYGGIRGIFNEKSWVRLMRIFQSVAGAFLQRFLTTGRILLIAVPRKSSYTYNWSQLG